MKLRYYQGLKQEAIPNLSRFVKAIEADDFARADMKKIGDNLYRAKLGRSGRLLFSFYAFNGQTDCLVLEYLPKHDYEKSRFLSRGVRVDEERIQAVQSITELEPQSLVYLNPANDRFHVLDKVLSFDDDQDAIYQMPAPLVLVGSAGSGKTALTLEKMKQAIGDVLYVSLSPYLVENARALYFANDYANDDQSLDFYSLNEFIESVAVPAGREASYQDFDTWFQRHKSGSGLKDSHALFEEFRGVLTGAVSDSGVLSRADYLALGIKQSIFGDAQRSKVYDLFERWCQHIGSANLYDANLLAHAYQKKSLPTYDFVVVDEVQDFTNVQLWLVLQCLRQAGDFLLCGDANQIVHPNFFSWSKLKSLFFENRGLAGSGETLAILHANYRNSPLVTAVANRILKLKHARFGSVDRESNHLVTSQGEQAGELVMLEDTESVRADLDARTGRSTRFAVIVMHNEDKIEAARVFSTPLIFSIQEAKGLEYENIILFNLVNGEEKAFRDIAAGVDAAQLDTDSLDYSRAKNKSDKSLEIYKFYINSLYVAVTRAVKSLYIVEQHINHPVLTLLDLERFTGELSLEKDESSLDDWQREARKLELQGKHDQAEAIHERILQRKPVPWPVIDRESFEALRDDALEKGHKKQMLRCYEYTILHRHESTFAQLRTLQYKPARQSEEKALKQLYRNHFLNYELSSAVAVLKETELYGIDHRTVFNWTPLMVAARAGNVSLAKNLLDRGADPTATANHGLNVAQQVLEYATVDTSYATKVAPLWPVLTQASVSIQVQGRLVKLHEKLMALFLLNLCIAHFHRSLGSLIGTQQVFSASFFADIVQDLPEQILPERRKRQQYISGVLSSNEIDRDAPYNRRLFKRIRRGQYIINPNLKIRNQGKWRPIHDILPLADLAVGAVHVSDVPIHSEAQRQLRERLEQDMRWRRERALEKFVAHVESMIDVEVVSSTATAESIQDSEDLENEVSES
ncbi:hypothetical protein OAM69_01605 [bacterium]|nr:hypothetical protein [bacterium]